MQPEDDRPPREPDELPRQTFWAAFPKRTFMRIVMLLALLGAIIYLRERTSAIAGCMSNAFRALPPAPPESAGGAVRARIDLRLDASAKSAL